MFNVNQSTMSKKLQVSNVNETDFMSPSAETIDILLPNNKLLTLRERNGEDEGILSTVGDYKNGNAIPKFLAALSNGALTALDIKQWPIRNKYYAMFKERIANFGSVVEWDHTFADGTIQRVGEELSKFDWDFTKGTPPAQGEEGYVAGRIIPYPMGEDRYTGTTSSGKNYRFEYLTGIGEEKTLEVGMDALNLNTKLITRNFEVQVKTGTWMKVERFNIFTGKEMSEIRTTVELVDPDFSLNVYVKHPKGGATEEISLFGVPDFFYPRAKAV